MRKVKVNMHLVTLKSKDLGFRCLLGVIQT